MRAKELMTREPACVSPEDLASKAARLMREHDCGCLPVVEGNGARSVVGVVTDRDLTVRGLAEGADGNTPVAELMTRDPHCCQEDTGVDEIRKVMSDRQVRRVPIIDGDGKLVGIIAQADIAREADEGLTDHEVAGVVERISEPGEGVAAVTAE